MNKKSKILIIGSYNFISKSLERYLIQSSYKNVVHLEITKSIKYSLLKSEKVFLKFKPDYVFLIGGLSGGISFNKKNPHDLMMSNLVTDIISLPLSHKYKIKKLIYVGSSCMYPKNIKNNASPNIILSSSLEETNLHYATSKITGMILCDAFNKQFGTNFITVIPSNYFGPNDDFSKENSHVIPALINKIHEAKKKNKKIIKVWGSGKPIRDFLYVEDMIKALIFLMKNYRSTKPINISSNHIYSIKEITYLLKQIIGYDGKVKFDITKPDGTYFKSLDNSKVKKLGWKHSFTFKESLELTYKWYLGTKINKL